MVEEAQLIATQLTNLVLPIFQYKRLRHINRIELKATITSTEERSSRKMKRRARIRTKL